MIIKLRNSKLVIEFIHQIKEWIYRFKYLSITNNMNKSRMGIAMIDGRILHGGMSDRFKGIISFYYYCLSKGIDFRINYSSPYYITDYLVPNKYDWTIDQKDIPNSIFNVRPFIATAEMGSRLLRLNTNKTILYYGNRDISRSATSPYANYNWGETFKFLFKPSDFLQSQINIIKSEIGNNYISAVFRFQNLLGDFVEYDFKPIEREGEKRNLILRCLNELEKLHLRYPDMSILVTSDSSLFLQEAKKLNFVYIIRGQVKHVEAISSDKDFNQLKFFLDFFILSDSKMIFSIVIDKMFPSEFPLYAAKINNIPFIRVCNKDS